MLLRWVPECRVVAFVALPRSSILVALESKSSERWRSVSAIRCHFGQSATASRGMDASLAGSCAPTTKVTLTHLGLEVRYSFFRS